MKLRLEARTKEQELVKAYLEENASDILADKINNGVRIVKDGRTLLNKKTLGGFMTYAADNYISKAEKHGLKIILSETLRDLFRDHNGEQMSPQSQPDPSPTELAKHWVDDNTYIDEDGVVHSGGNGSDRKLACDMTAYDAGALAVLKNIFEDLLVLR